LNTRVKIICFLIVFVATNFVTYNRALLDGFLRGQSHQIVESSRSEASSAVFALELLKKNETEKAIKILEMSLDSAIYAHGLHHDQDNSPPWPVSELNFDPENKAMTRVAKYRNIYPVLEGNPKIKKKIESTVERYLK